DRGVLERHLHPVDDVAAGRAAGPAASEAGETEEVLEEVGELAEDRRVESGKARPAARDAGVPEPVVAGPLLGVGEDGVGLGGFLELLGRLGIAGIAVRVVRQGELAVRRLQLAVDGFPAYTEDLVVITLRHLESLWLSRRRRAALGRGRALEHHPGQELGDSLHVEDRFLQGVAGVRRGDLAR